MRSDKRKLQWFWPYHHELAEPVAKPVAEPIHKWTRVFQNTDDYCNPRRLSRFTPVSNMVVVNALLLMCWAANPKQSLALRFQKKYPSAQWTEIE